jgi:hypothetical protein
MFNNEESDIPQVPRNPEREEKISYNLRVTMYMLFFLAAFRILAAQYFWMLSDLLTALVVYCTYTSKSKMMAIFCIINGIMGIIYAITLGVMDLNKLNNPQKNELIKSNNITTPNDPKDNSPNFPFYNNSMDDIPTTATTVSFIYYIIIFNLIAAVIIYSLITYFSIFAFKYYSSIFGEPIYNQPQQQNFDYGATSNNNFYRNQNINGFNNYRNDQNPAQSAHQSRSFVPFSGKGVTMGDTVNA